MAKTSSLNPTAFKNGLQVIVSDPSIPAGPGKASKRFDLSKLPAVGRQWDITPTVVEDYTPPLTYVDNYYVNVAENGELSMDLFGSPVVNIEGQPVYKHGCIKTNIDLSLMADGDAWHISAKMLGLQTNAGQVGIFNILLANKARAAGEVASAFLDLFANDAPTEYLYAASVLSFNQSTGFGSYMTTHETNPERFVANNETFGSEHHPQNTSERLFLLVTRHGGTLQYALAVRRDDNTYDIGDIYTFGDVDNPVSIDTLGLYFYFGSIASPGEGGHWTNVASPSLSIDMPSYNISGTIFENKGSQNDWDTTFTTAPHTPNGDLVDQAEFPTDARAGEVLNTYINPTHPINIPVTPYGQLTTTGKTVLVTNTATGHEAFESIVRAGDLTPIMAAIADLSASAGGGAWGETVVFVNPTDNPVAVEFSGAQVFDTLDAAYDYLLTLPAYGLKRIVFDDRPINGGTEVYVSGRIDGGVPRKYYFRQHNIALSTYTAYSGEAWPEIYADNTLNPRPVYYIAPRFNFTIYADGLYFKDFWGNLDRAVSDDGYMAVDLSQPIDSVSAPAYMSVPSNLRVGKGTALWVSPVAVEIYNGGRIDVEDDAYLNFSFYLRMGEAPINAPVIIRKSKQSRLDLNTVGSFATQFPTNNAGYSIGISRAQNSIAPNYIDATLAHTTNEMFVSDPGDPVFMVDNVTMIRSVNDFIVAGANPIGNKLILPANDMLFFIVGTVSLNGYSLSGPSNGSLPHYRFIGFKGARLENYNPVVWEDVTAAADYTISGVDIANLANSGTNLHGLVTNYGTVVMENMTVKAVGYVDISTTPDLISQAVPYRLPHRLQNVVFEGQRANDLVGRIDPSTGVVMRDIVVAGGQTQAGYIFDFTTARDNTFIDIDGFSVVSGPVNGPLFKISPANPSSAGSIDVRGVSVAESSADDQYANFYSLFKIDNYASVYDYTQDSRITTDHTTPFFYCKETSRSVAITSGGEFFQVPLGDNGVGQVIKKNGFYPFYGYVKPSFGEFRMFEVRFRANVHAGNNQTIRFYWRFGNQDTEGSADYREVVTDGSGNVAVDVDWLRGMGAISAFSVWVQTGSTASPIDMTNIVLKVHEF